ncbi:MAG: glycerophosphodiester phosphodiesterase [Chloroflexota bacterium]
MLDLRSTTRGRPWIIGHRGASGEAPENTLAAFRLALEQGADLIETDVHLTSDGVPVLVHDHSVDRTTNGRGLVAQMTLAQIKALDAGSWFAPEHAGERILTLDELLEWAAGKTPVSIEIKNGPIYYPEIEDRVVDTLRRHDMVRTAIVISFDHSVLLRAKQRCPDLLTGVLFACTPVAASSLALQAQADCILPHWSNLNGEMVEEAHSHDLAVSPWVVDNEEEMGWVLAQRIDAIATNYPARVASWLKRER